MVLQYGVHGGDGGIGGILGGKGASGDFNAPWCWLATVSRDEVGWGEGGRGLWVFGLIFELRYIGAGFGCLSSWAGWGCVIRWCWIGVWVMLSWCRGGDRGFRCGRGVLL